MNMNSYYTVGNTDTCEMTPSTDILQPVTRLLWISIAVALAYYVYGRSLRRSANTTDALSRARRSLKIGLPITYLVTLLAMSAGGWPDVVDAGIAAAPLSETVLGSWVVISVLFGVPAVGPIAGYLGLFPAIKTLRDVEMTWGRATVVLGRFVAVIVGIFGALLLGVTTVVAALPSGIGLIVGIVGMVVALIASDPYTVRLSQATRAPTSSETDRLERLLADLETDVVGIRVLKDEDANQHRALLRGFPGRRHLLVSDRLLESAADDRLRAILAVRAGQARMFRLEAHLFLGVGAAVATVSPLLGVVPVSGWTAWGVSSLAALVGAGVLWTGRTLVFRGDEFAAERVGEDRVADAIEWITDRHDIPLSWSRRQMILRMMPSPKQRLQRLSETPTDRGF